MNNISAIFKSLEDLTRLRIMSLLLKEDELCVCYIVDVLQLPQSTVSRHISILKKSGWLTDRREGLWVYYSISRTLAPIQQFLIPVLSNFLPATAIAAEDQVRLKAVIRENCYK